VVLPITFAKGQSALSESAQEFLRTYATEMKGYGSVEGVQIYVVGLAPEEPDQKQQWLLSAQRAQVVATYLRDQLPSGTGSRVFSWGAATGGEWVKKDGPVSAQSQIAIAVLRPNR